HGPTAVGNVTSGGTESNLLAMKIARDRARSRGIDGPLEVVMPLTAHPSLWKSAHYLGLQVHSVALDDNYDVELRAYRAAITSQTAMCIGSAPNVCTGAVDPIPSMAELAAERDITFHSDACIGGFFLPFARQLGRSFDEFDFGVPGVSTISADLHKFG